MKAYSRRFLQLINYHQFSDHFTFDSQLVIRAILLDFRIEEVPIPTHYSEDSYSVDVVNSVKYILGTFLALYRGIRDREHIWQECNERAGTIES